MEGSRALSLALGALAVSSGVSILTFDIIFAVDLYQNSSPVETKVIAIVASGLGAATIGLLSTLLGRQLRRCVQNSRHWRRHTYLCVGLGGVLGVCSATASAMLLGMILSRHEFPKTTLLADTNIVTGAFIAWAISLLSEAVFLIYMIIIQRKHFQTEAQAYTPGSESQNFAEMMQSSRLRASSLQRSVETAGREKREVPSTGSPPSTGRSRTDTCSSFRSSFSQAVRPISSKTKLLSHNHRSPRRPRSMESTNDNQRETKVSIEDDFDSWDTSGVDEQSREAVASALPTPQGFLETIPASPTTSRAGSPGFPLDLEPPRSRKRSRSYGPANSPRNTSRPSRTQSPTESMCSELHIHPLFRTDSSTPPPAATPGTIVTAAPGAGQVISDPQSIRSIPRMRSGSLPSSSLVHSKSLENVRYAMEREELERWEGIERTLTPPIPDFILNGTPRSSMMLYNSRRKPIGLGMSIVGEERDG